MSLLYKTLKRKKRNAENLIETTNLFHRNPTFIRICTYPTNCVLSVLFNINSTRINVLSNSLIKIVRQTN